MKLDFCQIRVRKKQEYNKLVFNILCDLPCEAAADSAALRVTAVSFFVHAPLSTCVSVSVSVMTCNGQLETSVSNI